MVSITVRNTEPTPPLAPLVSMADLLLVQPFRFIRSVVLEYMGTSRLRTIARRTFPTVTARQVSVAQGQTIPLTRVWSFRRTTAPPGHSLSLFPIAILHPALLIHRSALVPAGRFITATQTATAR